MRNNINPVKRRTARNKVEVDPEAMARWSLLKIIADAMKPIGDYSPSTMSAYRTACRNFQRFVGFEQSAVNVTEAKFEAFREWLQAEDYGKKTIELNLECLAAVVRFADKELLPSRQTPERKPFADADTKGTIEWYMVTEYFPVASRIKSDETKRQYAMAVARFSTFLGQAARLPDLNDDTIGRWVASLLGEQLQRKTINGYMNYLRAFWSWAASRGMVVDRPTIKNIPVNAHIPDHAGGDLICSMLWRGPRDRVTNQSVTKNKRPRRHSVRRGSKADEKSHADLLGPRGALRFVDRYLSTREVSKSYAANLRLAMKRLARFAGRSDITDLFAEDIVNEFIASLDLSPYSVQTVLTNLVVLWNAAADEDYVPYPRLRRLRRPKCPELIIECYTLDEVTRLLRAASELKGEYSNGIPKRTYWSAAIRFAWDSGLRRGDVILFRKSVVRPDGSFRVVQHKTGQIVTCRLRESTRAAIALIQHDQAFEWKGGDINYFTRHFRQIVRASGVGKGTFKWLRRSSATYVDMEQIGAGTKHLGHACPQVFDRHYNGQLREYTAPQPPELPS